MSTNVHLVNGGKNELMSIRGLDELFFPGSAEKYSRIVEAVSRLVTTPEALGNVERSALLMIKMGKIPANMAADMLLYQATWERRLVRPVSTWYRSGQVRTSDDPVLLERALFLALRDVAREAVSEGHKRRFIRVINIFRGLLKCAATDLSVRRAVQTFVDHLAPRVRKVGSDGIVVPPRGEDGLIPWHTDASYGMFNLFPYDQTTRLRAQCDREDVTGLFYQAMYVYFKGGLNRDHPTLLAGMYICAAAFAGAPGVEFAFLGLVSFRVRFKEEEYGVLFNTYRAVAPDLRETYESAFASAQSVMARHIPGVTLYDEVCDCVNPSSSAGEGVRGFQAWGRSVQNAAEARECEAQMRKGMAGGLAAGALMFGLVIMRIPRERMTPPWTRLAQAWTQVEESDAQTQRS
eukprot:jgi/Mesvir1/20115/Mv13354-RA.1